MCKSKALQRAIPYQRHGVEHELPLDTDSKFSAVFPEVPDVEAARGGQAQIDAGMFCQVVRCKELWPTLEVRRCRQGRQRQGARHVSVTQLAAAGYDYCLLLSWPRLPCACSR